MKILTIGNGSREHSIVESLAISNIEPVIFNIGSLINPGILELCEKSGGKVVRSDPNDPKKVVEIAESISPDFAVIGPEEPQFHGVPDALLDAGIATVGATTNCSMIERSKAWMRRLMFKYKIVGRLRFKSFTSVEEAIAYINAYAESIVLKPARQSGGKGVRVISDLQEYLKKEKRAVKEKHAKYLIEKHMKPYSDIDDKILIEEKVSGTEYTLQCFSDGHSVIPTPLVQDNKPAFDGDLGPETGGMGCCSYRDTLPFITKEEVDDSLKIIKQSVDAIQKETDEKYKGIIAGQMMLTSLWGPTLIEFYSRFGDPEGVNVLPIMKTDFVEVCEAIISEKLNKIKIEFEDQATVVKAIAPRGYPDYRDLAKGHPISVDLKLLEKYGVRPYYGSIDVVNGSWITGGSRSIELFAKRDTIEEANEATERCIPAAKLLDGHQLFHRSDIGSKERLLVEADKANLAREIYLYRKEHNLIGRKVDWIPLRGKIEYKG